MTRHPRWCEHRDLCDVFHTHQGRLVEIRTADGDQAAVTVQLFESTVAGLDPYIVVRGDAGHVLLSINQARALCFATRNMIRRGRVDQ